MFYSSPIPYFVVLLPTMATKDIQNLETFLSMVHNLSPSNKEHNIPKGIYKTSCSKTILIKYKRQCKTKSCQTYCIVQYVQEQCALRFFKYSIPHTLLLLRKQASIFHRGSTLWKMALNPETHL